MITYSNDKKNSSFPYITIFIILINVIIFIFGGFVFGNKLQIDNFGFIPAEFEILKIFTSIFIHANILHLIGSMIFLYVFGKNIEHAFGKVAYLISYLFFGSVVAIVQYLIDPFSTIPIIGANGAISGMFGAYLLFNQKSNMNFSILNNLAELKYVIFFWAVVQFTMNYLYNNRNSGIAHIGGLLQDYLLRSL